MKHDEHGGDPTTSVCVQCGKINTQALYKKFTGGTIQLSQCVGLFSIVILSTKVNDIHDSH